MYQFVINKFQRHKTLIVCHYAIEPWKAVHWLFKLLVVFKNTSIVKSSLKAAVNKIEANHRLQ